MELKEISVEVFPDGRMDTKNAAIYVGVSTQTMAKMRMEGKGPKFIKPGKVFYYRKDLDEWLQTFQSVNSTAQTKAS